MSVKIRLARGGAKKRPYYRIVVADARSPRDGKFIEKIGTYNPMLSSDDEKRVVIVKDRAEYWLNQGANPTERVALFFKKESIDLPEFVVKQMANKEKNRKARPPKKEKKD